MLTDKIIVNKIYLYAGDLFKVKKVQKIKNNIILKNLQTGDFTEIPLNGSDLLLKRLYTIGELSKIVERRPDTIRKYEKNGLLSKPDSYTGGESYSGWRFYTIEDVHHVMNFFSSRTPGRPSIDNNKLDSFDLKKLNQKFNLMNRSF